MSEPTSDPTSAASAEAAGGYAGPMAGGRRRIDRVLSDGFLDRLTLLSLDEVRGRRREAEQEEADLSYLRRLLQGRLDLVRAEQARRGGAPSGEGGSIVDALPGILADGARSTRGSGRHLTVEPSRVDDHRRAAEALAADTELSDPQAMTDGELAGALATFTEAEQAVSEARRQVQAAMDALTAEVARRYRDGEATVDELLARP
jgi:hypothetical protein